MKRGEREGLLEEGEEEVGARGRGKLGGRGQNGGRVEAVGVRAAC